MKSTFHSHRFENGLTLVHAELPQMASVSVGIWAAVGGRHEEEQFSGASHFIEHMLFKGTKRRSARDISQAIEGLGGYLNAFTSEEHTCFFAKARHDHFEEVLEVLTDMLLDSTFAAGEIAKERDVILEELAMYMDQPHHRVEELLNATQWPGQALGRPLTGTKPSIQRLGRGVLVDFHRRHYVAPAVVIAVAGPLAPQKCRRLVARQARRFRAGSRAAFEPARPNSTGPVLGLDRMRTEQTQLALGIRTCSRHDERRFALRLLNVLLGENMSSRLFQSLREDTGLAYHVASALSFFDDVGDVVVSAGLDHENLTRALRLVTRELRRLKQGPPSPGELRRARDYVIGQMDLSLENSENQMMWLGEQWLGYGRLISPAWLKARLARVTPSQIQAAATDFFRPERLSLALVSPLRRADAAKVALARV